ncbi:MAG TPA: DUF21 domain-containing protein [Syntrophales bacterium]|nr:DUF21 domain-containing protein [Syntrophales bacterium]
MSYFLVVVTVTCLLLVFGELIPKRLALLRPESIASAFAPPMMFLSWLAAPAVFLLSLSTDGLLRILSITGAGGKESGVSEDEIKQLFRQGARAGIFHPSEVTLGDTFGLPELDGKPATIPNHCPGPAPLSLGCWEKLSDIYERWVGKSVFVSYNLDSGYEKALLRPENGLFWEVYPEI